jgi:hypothetical protein
MGVWRRSFIEVGWSSCKWVYGIYCTDGTDKMPSIHYNNAITLLVCIEVIQHSTSYQI